MSLESVNTTALGRTYRPTARSGSAGFSVLARLLGRIVQAIRSARLWDTTALDTETKQGAERWRTVELQRLEQADRQIMPVLFGHVEPTVTTQVVKEPGKPDKTVTTSRPVSAESKAHLQLKAHSRVLASSERRSRLLGLDAPTKVTATDPTGDMNYLSWTEEELDRRMAEKEQELGLQPVIDVETERQGDKN